MKVRWTPEALADRNAIWEYISHDSTEAAARMDRLFSDAVLRLEDYPMLGHPGAVHGTRELTPHKSYKLVYEVDNETVWVLAIVHTARQWPPVRALGRDEI